MELENKEAPVISYCHPQATNMGGKRDYNMTLQKRLVNKKLKFKLVGNVIRNNGIEIREKLVASWKGQGDKKAVAIGINPSVARTDKSDKTVTTLVKFLDAYECSEVTMINLYEHVATKQSDIDFRTETKFEKHQQLLEEADFIIIVWGMDKKSYVEQKEKALKLLESYYDKTYCIVTPDGRYPAHPSRMQYAYNLEKYYDLSRIS